MFNPPKGSRTSPPRIDFGVNYAPEKDYTSSSFEFPVNVRVEQLPNQAWALNSAKYPPDYNLILGNPQLVLNPVTKFGNRIVMDRQFRFPDESGKLVFFWASGRNFITITYDARQINEEFLRRYLEKYPSSL